MSESNNSKDIVETAMTRLRDAPVPDGPSSVLLASTADQMNTVGSGNAVPLSSTRRSYMLRMASYGSIAGVLASFLAAVAWFVLVERSTSVAVAQVNEQIEKVMSAQYMQTSISDGKRQRIRHMILGRFLSRDEYLGASGQVERILISDAKNALQVSIEPESKQCVITQFNAPESTTGIDLYRSLREYRIPDNPTRRLPERQIGEQRVVGFYFEEKDEWSTKATFWIDVKTKLPVRVEVSSNRPHQTVASDFDFDKHLDASLFSTDPPAGFDVRRRQARVVFH